MPTTCLRNPGTVDVRDLSRNGNRDISEMWRRIEKGEASKLAVFIANCYKLTNCFIKILPRFFSALIFVFLLLDDNEKRNDKRKGILKTYATR